MSVSEIQQQIDGYLGSGIGKIVVGNYDDAVRDLKAAEALDRENPEILYNLGICYSRMGLFKTAVKYFEKIINLPSTFVEVLTVYKILAFIYVKTGNYSKGEMLLTHVLKYSQADISALNMKAYCLEKQKKYFESVKIYERILELDNGNVTACNSLAYMYALTEGDLKKALTLVEKALESAKDNPAYLDTAGFIYLKMNDLEKAEQYITEAYALSPFSPEIADHYRSFRKKSS